MLSIDFSGVLQGRLGLPNSIPTVGSSGENEARRENFVVSDCLLMVVTNAREGDFE